MKYKSKSKYVEALQFNEDNFCDISDFVSENEAVMCIIRHQDTFCEIKSDGKIILVLFENDYIIKENGKFIGMTEDEFNNKYEKL
jgi:hypothetical protein